MRPSLRLVLAVSVVLAAAGCTSSATTGPSAPPSSTRPSVPAAPPTVTTSVPAAASSPPPSSSEPPASAATTSTPTTSTPTTSTTVTVTTSRTVRPVSGSGTVTAGWTVQDVASTIDCSAGLRSPVSESAGVLYCAPSAASAIACWRAADTMHAYCLRDPRSRTLVRYALTGAFPAAGRSELEPVPVALDLVTGVRCSARVGGAAAQLRVHPDWVPYYFCGAQDATAVWAPQASPDGGITRGDGPWTVQLGAGDGSGTLTTGQVAVAYFVGTA